MLVVKDGDVKFVQTGKGGGIDRLLDSIPDLLEKVKVKAEEAKGRRVRGLNRHPQAPHVNEASGAGPNWRRAGGCFLFGRMEFPHR